jgi:F0F1-type ATP synthase membrane subunit c/vacuolar-type H+-ATPase subunit K
MALCVPHRLGSLREATALRGVVIALLLFASCVAAFFFFISRPIAEESGQRALLAQLRIDLAEYRAKDGAFPPDLSVIRVSKFSGGASPVTLQRFHYASDGASFTLSCVGASTHEVITATSADLAATRTPK